MFTKILTTPFLAYFATMITVAVMGRKTAVDLFGNTVEELWLIWIQIILAVWLLKYFRNRLTNKLEDV